MTDNGRHLIVVAHVSDAVNDKQQVAQPLPWAGTVLADTGYHSAANLALCENRGLAALIAEGREGKAVHTRCKATVETVFGMIKKVTGFRHFHLQGVHAAGGEWTLVSLAWNLKRMHALAASTRQEQGIRAPEWAAASHTTITRRAVVAPSWPLDNCHAEYVSVAAPIPTGSWCSIWRKTRCDGSALSGR